MITPLCAKTATSTRGVSRRFSRAEPGGFTENYSLKKWPGFRPRSARRRANLQASVRVKGWWCRRCRWLGGGWGARREGGSGPGAGNERGGGETPQRNYLPVRHAGCWSAGKRRGQRARIKPNGEKERREPRREERWQGGGRTAVDCGRQLRARRTLAYKKTEDRRPAGLRL